jgi:site-specific DNA-cytosine methylase
MFDDMLLRHDKMQNKKDMFGGVTKDATLASVATHLGRPLRVATMCSGTESPLLALDMMCKSVMKQNGVKLDIDHVFSCEIEPFKQAYIERNFQPPILFRDIRELGAKQATTAYGSLVDVPGNVDMLVAGTSCVDYSTLNNEKKDIDSKGESGQTFRGMMDWIKKFMPAVVILENVCGAPWDLIRQRFEKEGYSSEWMRLDTKHYYIPHTRTRVYLLATLAKGAGVAAKWKAMVKQLERPSSSTLEAFMLDTDDPRVHNAREALSRSVEERKGGRVDWGRCESRHHRARAEEELGNKRPLTGWEEGGKCKLPDYAWNDWGKQQVDRVLDLCDINYIRAAKEGVDARYKTQVWNLSQNVDRETGSSKPGICPCLTPTMVPFVTNRGGPLIGLEALSLQGIPVNDLLLTRETQDQMADLAGNAMSATVVGAAMLAALTLSIDSLKNCKKGGAAEGGGAAADPTEQAEEEDAMLATEGSLVTSALQLDTAREVVDLDRLLDEARRSARWCVSEGQEGTSTDLLECIDCGHTVSRKCGGCPEHTLVSAGFDGDGDGDDDGDGDGDDDDERMPDSTPGDAGPAGGAPKLKRAKPMDFAKRLKSALPMRMALDWAVLRDASGAALDKLKAKVLEEKTGSGLKAKLDSAAWEGWKKTILALSGSAGTTGCSFRFCRLKRDRQWTAIFTAALPANSLAYGTVLRLVLDSRQPEWQLIVPPPPQRGPLRDFLERPVARMRIDLKDAAASAGTSANPLLAGKWELVLPVEFSFDLDINGHKEAGKIESWCARMGLQGEFKDEKQWRSLCVRVPEVVKAAGVLERQIEGLYELLPQCDGSLGGLHRRRGPVPGEKDAAASSTTKPLFLMHDPSRCGLAGSDHFVFSDFPHRVGYGEARDEFARLPNEWRPEMDLTAHSVRCTVKGRKVTLDNAVLSTSAEASVTAATVAAPAEPLKIELTPDSWRCSVPVIQCTVPLETLLGSDSSSKSSSAVHLEERRLWAPNDVMANASGSEGSTKVQQLPTTSRWAELDLQRSKTTFGSFAWFTQRLALPKPVNDWQEITPAFEDGAIVRCERCAPTAPTLKWVRENKTSGSAREKNVTVSKKITAREDPVEAGKYEQALKSRPAPFTMRVRLAETSGEMQLNVNAASLIHQALARLPNAASNDSQAKSASSASSELVGVPQLTWRVVEHTDTLVHTTPLKLSSNRHDNGNFKQPPNFKKYPLRKEQLRSLSWMVAQEATETPFVESEVIEAVLPAMGWRAEAKASIQRMVRGGVVADEVGYGKTAITLGLIDSRPVQQPKTEMKGHVFIPATLILVPAHLMNQWPKEISKFTGKRFKVMVLKTMSDFNRTSIKDFMEADIVVASITIIRSKLYFERLGAFAASMQLPPKGGRHFRSAYADTLAALQLRVAELQDEEGGGVDAILEAMDEAARKEEEEAAAFEGTKRVDGSSMYGRRLKGKKLVENTERMERLKTQKAGTQEAAPVIQPKKKQKAAEQTKVTASATTTATTTTTVVASKPAAPPAAPAAGKSVLSFFNMPSKAAPPTPALAAAVEVAETGTKRQRGEDEDTSLHENTGDADDDEAEADDAEEEEYDDEVEHGSDDDDEEEEEQEEEGEEDSEEEDEEEHARSKKRAKASSEAKKKAGGKKQSAEDPWGLRSSKSRSDWTELMCPPFELFQWGRVVVDEFTYLGKDDNGKGRDKDVVLHLRSNFRWCLSGTPPIETFDDIRGIACFLGIHLGIQEADGVGGGHAKAARGGKKEEHTKAEEFRVMMATQTSAWHARRHALGQQFLDRFVRQNIAEIDEIPREFKCKKVVLTPAERAVYLELEHHLQAMDMKTKKTVVKAKVKSKSGDSIMGDKDARLAAVLGAAGSAEEALLKRCSHFDLAGSAVNATEACKRVVELREEQLKDVLSELRTRLLESLELLVEVKQMKKLKGNGGGGDVQSAKLKRGNECKDSEKRVEDLPFMKWLTEVRGQLGSGDDDAAFQLHTVLKAVEAEEKGNDGKGKNDGGGNKRKKGETKSKDDKKKDKERTIDDAAWDLREHTHLLRALQKELVSRVRSLRYFKAIRDLQERVCCDSADERAEGMTQAVLSCCGHKGDAETLKDHAEKQECPVAGCNAPARSSSVVEAKALAQDPEDEDDADEETVDVNTFGSKLSAVIKLIRKIQKQKAPVTKKKKNKTATGGVDAMDEEEEPEEKADQRVLVFVQFGDLMEKVQYCSTHYTLRSAHYNNRSRARSQQEI